MLHHPRRVLPPGGYATQPIHMPTLPPRGIGAWDTAQYDMDFTHIADPRDLADSSGLGGVFGVPTFLWVGGDGNTPTIGPSLSLTGTPTVSDSPFELEDGSSVQKELQSGSSYRVSSGDIDPVSGADIVVALMGIMPPSSAVGSRFFSTRAATRGVAIQIQSGSTRAGFIVSTSGGTAIVTNFANTAPMGSIFFFIGIYDASGDTAEIWTPVGSVTPVAVPDGTITGTKVGFCATPAGTLPLGAYGGVVFVAHMSGVGIATDWTADSHALCERLYAQMTGVYPAIGAPAAFSRNSAASWESAKGVWHIIAPETPRAGDASGLRAAPARTNKVANNINPQATTGWITHPTGGTLSVQDDSTALAAAGLGSWGPNAMQYANAVSSSRSAYCSVITTGNTNAHSLSVWVRGVSGGEFAELCLIDQPHNSVTVVDSLTLTTGYQRMSYAGATPVDTDVSFGIRIGSSETMRFIGAQMEEGATLTTAIPNWATGASATRGGELLTTTHTPDDGQGSIEAIVAPMGWDGPDAVYARIIDRSGSTAGLIYINASGNYAAYDGTSEVSPGVLAEDNIEQNCRFRWAGESMRLSVGANHATEDYDGDLVSSGQVTIEPSIAECRVTELRCYESG